MSRSKFARLVVVSGGVFGAIGVMSAAGASHSGDARNLGAIASICLAHGPALLALGLHGVRGRLYAGAALLLGFGTLIFVGDLALRQWLGASPLPVAAPVGGIGMIAGWLMVILGGITAQATE
ncbi:DUF423 domain-containing protein [Devosia algicola]|uniref:DUF423 domain-containing protein n=1 Tax=Devosia algicola TaxID=3026418 RepID=A0ABY7YR50_9HYPH|nr:DUF423 domain-containing protein [Devosia algicola]WDR03809.1 DUF423 domain-containing protein [Devosia algicola]